MRRLPADCLRRELAIFELRNLALSALSHELAKKFNERSQEVIENKRDQFIANCKAKRLLKTKELFL